MAKQFKGTGVAVITPFHNYGTIDFSALEKTLNHIINGDVDFVLALGTTSEAATLSADEKNAVVNYFVEIVDGRVPIMLGVGGNNTQDVVDTIKSLSFDGIDAILSVAPYYNRPQQKGMYYHFKTIAGACPVPVYLYNVPSRTASNISAETVLKLAEEIDNIVGIKEASGDFSQIMQIIKNKPKGFTVLSGDDALTLPMISLGGEGVISVIANAFPKEYSTMVNAALKGNYSSARTLHYQMIDMIDAIFADGNPAGVKAAMEMLDICKSNLRLPLVKVNKSVYNRIKALIDEM
jgi:4-hydroxy-tetrahydrodipicolinate synthase